MLKVTDRRAETRAEQEVYATQTTQPFSGDW